MLKWLFGDSKKTAENSDKPSLDLSNLEVVGESFYQKQLSKICGGKSEDGHNLEKIGFLRPEPKNPHDKNAVAVFVGRHQVGYLQKEDAISFNRHIGKPTEIEIEINGGWYRESGDEGHFGVKILGGPL